jgi:hypothetical protein
MTLSTLEEDGLQLLHRQRFQSAVNHLRLNSFGLELVGPIPRGERLRFSPTNLLKPVLEPVLIPRTPVAHVETRFQPGLLFRPPGEVGSGLRGSF